MGGGPSYLVFHYSPSVLTARFNLSQVFFPLCAEPLLLRDDSQPECMFSPRRRAKVETRSVFANDKFVKLMQDVTRDKAEKDI